MEESISLTEAAIRLRRSYTQVLRLILIHELHGWQDAGRWRVRREDVDRLVRALIAEARRVAQDDAS